MVISGTLKIVAYRCVVSLWSDMLCGVLSMGVIEYRSSSSLVKLGHSGHAFVVTTCGVLIIPCFDFPLLLNQISGT